MVDTKELLRSVDLASLLTALSGEPIGTGHRRRWHCIAPDHNDEHPSVSIRVDAHGVQRWKCWSDGRGGTAIDAIMVRYNVDIRDAIQRLHTQHPHVPLARPERRTPTVKPRSETTTATMRNWVDRSHTRLKTPSGQTALTWLRARGISDAMIDANQIGVEHSKPTARGTFAKTGMPHGTGVVIPAFDAHGALVAAQLRLLKPVGKMKYIMPGAPQRPMPPVSFPRHGTGDVLVVTEGIFDAITVNQAGYRGAALASTAVNMDTAAAMIAETSPAQVVLALDGDQAGQRATIGLRNALSSRGICAAVLKIPAGEDLNSLHTKDNTQWQTHAKSATPSIR